MSQNKKHVHFIGICGVAMAPIAKMYLDLGWKVSGSDAGFFPPMSDYLKAHPGISFYPGFHPEKMGRPDVVVVGNFVGSNNPEFKYVKEQGFMYQSYPESLEQHVVKENSIVVVGTYGKSTTAAAVAWILERAGYNPSFMSGGIQENFEDGVRTTDSEWSVLEGDEYPASRWKPVSKFFYYHPKYLILTSAEWDHMDVFPTEAEYTNAFVRLVSDMPSDGLIVANKLGKNVEDVVSHASCRVVWYQQAPASDDVYYLGHREHTDTVTTFVVHNNARSFEEQFTSPLIGKHILENITGAITLASVLGIDLDIIRRAVDSFKGVRRRLEIRGKTKRGALVIDDLAHSPTKARVTISALKHWMEGSRIIAVYEPNVGSRTEASLPSYDKAFGLADEVIIPRLSIAKTKAGEKRLNGEELAACIQQTQPHTRYVEDDDELVEYLKQHIHDGDVIVFMSSHGFRGMIEEVLR